MTYLEYLRTAEKINQNVNVNKLILIHLLDKNLVWLYANLNTKDTSFDTNKYFSLVKKYTKGYPLAYILGYVLVNNKKIFVDKRVLIPRDETQYLIQQTEVLAKEYFGCQKLRVLDLATGSGYIATMLGFNKNFNIIASDISSKALEVAKKNIKFYKMSNVKIVKSDLFENFTNEKFDIIISNPPYIDESCQNFNSQQLSYEPKIALFAEIKGLIFYQKIFKQIQNHINDKFLLAFEFGFDQKGELEKLIKENFSKKVIYYFVKDINNHWRYVFIKG